MAVVLLVKYSCPVCFLPDMQNPPKDYNICPQCGTEFGNDDLDWTYDELRDAWIAAGMPWFYKTPETYTENG
jgi:hypothetical protein